jgi:hypothetical protein
MNMRATREYRLKSGRSSKQTLRGTNREPRTRLWKRTRSTLLVNVAKFTLNRTTYQIMSQGLVVETVWVKSAPGPDALTGSLLTSNSGSIL